MHAWQPTVLNDDSESPEEGRTLPGRPGRRAAGAARRALARVTAAIAGALLLAFVLAPPAGNRPALSPFLGSAHALERRLESSAAARAARADGDLSLVSGPFTVYYPPGHAAEARLVLYAANRYAPRVYADLGVRGPSHLNIIVEPDDSAMDRDLGLDGPAPVGAYWSGTLWVLAPSAWLDGADAAGGWAPGSPAGRAFLSRGPVAHELAHAALDQRLGRQPETWFDEGVAQFEDARETGFVWREPANDFDQPLYTYQELMRDFDRLPNVALAYRQAYALVDALAKADGGHGLQRALALMQDGASADEAARTVLGPDYAAWRAGAPWKDAPATEPAAR